MKEAQQWSQASKQDLGPSEGGSPHHGSSRNLHSLSRKFTTRSELSDMPKTFCFNFDHRWVWRKHSVNCRPQNWILVFLAPVHSIMALKILTNGLDEITHGNDCEKGVRRPAISKQIENSLETTVITQINTVASLTHAEAPNLSNQFRTFRTKFWIWSGYFCILAFWSTSVTFDAPNRFIGC